MKTPFVIERTFNASPDKVWKAISDKDEMKQWYFDLPDFKPELGCEFRFYGGEEGKKQYLHICVVTEVTLGKKLTYSWRYDGYAGISYVTFELFAEGNTTRLKLTHAGLETFSADESAFAQRNFEMGWTEIIGTSLAGYLREPEKKTAE